MIARVALFTTHKERLFFLLVALFIAIASLGYEFYSYKKFTAFDSQLIEAKVLKQYTKTKTTKQGYSRTYQVLKLKSNDGLNFYTIAPKKLEDVKGKILSLEIWAGDITFLEYLRTFFAYGKILNIDENESFKNSLEQKVQNQHTSLEIASLYNALYFAHPLNAKLQERFSYLGVSHLIAISGFHLGLLFGFLLLLLRKPYIFLQDRYFPFRSFKRDSFFIISTLLFFYMLFLETPPSLLRAFVMLVVGFILYDRGVKILSMETLFVAVVLILALFPKLLFSIGFWLSVAGVFYIFLFLIHFEKRSKIFKFILLPIWIYIMMLPYSLSIFASFSLYHPLSIILTALFTLFYPLSIVAHTIAQGALFDSWLQILLSYPIDKQTIKLDMEFLYLQIALSFVAIFRREALWLLLFFSSSIFIYSIYYVTEF